MKVLIGVDPHKASVAVAAVDEAKGELLERASFPQDRAGLRALERWARRFPQRRWAVENAGGLGRYLAVRLAGWHLPVHRGVHPIWGYALRLPRLPYRRNLPKSIMSFLEAVYAASPSIIAGSASSQSRTTAALQD